MTDVIKTNLGVGAPAYTDDHAPAGGQFTDGINHLKIPEGTKVQKTGKINNAKPTPFLEINILDGMYVGVKNIWVKSTHVLTLPVVPPVPEGSKKWRVINWYKDADGIVIETIEIK